MKLRSVLAVLVLSLSACVSTPNYSGLAARSVQSTVALVIQNEKGETRSYCSGVAITKDIVLTAAHCMGAPQKLLKTPDGKVYEFIVLTSDDTADIAALRAYEVELTPAPLGDSSLIKAGESVMAIGMPFGLPWFVSVGIVSTPRITVYDPQDGTDLGSFIMSDVLINPGNSGGPLFNMAGEVIGINTRGGMGMTLAVAINDAKEVLKRI